MLDVTSCEKAASLYVFIFLIFLMFSEVLYEDEAFKQRQLSALLASKVCDSIHVQCVIESIPMFMQSCKQFFSLERTYTVFPTKTLSWSSKRKFWSYMYITKKRLKFTCISGKTEDIVH